MKGRKNAIILNYIIFLFIKTDLTLYLIRKNNQLQKVKQRQSINIIETTNDIPKKKEKLYISIDFGNYKTGFAYKFGENNNDDIYIGKMQSIRSVVVLNKTNYIGKNYGWQSIHSISNYKKEELAQLIFVDNLKLSLFNKTINEKLENKDILNLDKIHKKGIIEFLRLFSDDALKEINSLYENENDKYIKDEVNWIISAPKFWDDYSKLNLIKLSKKAGLKNIDLVLESEVASLAMIQDKFTDAKIIKEGNIFMLLDIGDYKLDITINQIIDSFRNIKIISGSIGDTYGLMNINNDLINQIKFIMGNDTLKNAKEKNLGEYLETLSDIENIKKKFNGNEKNNFEIYAKFERKKKSIFETNKFLKKFFYRIYNYFYPQVENNIPGISFNDFKIYISGKILKDIMEKRINEIINYIKKIVTQFNKYSSYEIDNIILTGGFTQNKYLIQKLKNNFPKIEISIIFNQEYSIMKGAILYSLNKNIIHSKICDFTYEIETYKIYNKNDICLKIEEINEYKLCQKIVSLINKGDIIVSNFEINKVFKIINKGKIFINFYKNKRGKSEFFTKMEIDINEINQKNMTINVNIKFNSYFQINVFDKITKKPIKHFLKFKN